MPQGLFSSKERKSSETVLVILEGQLSWCGELNRWSIIQWRNLLVDIAWSAVMNCGKACIQWHGFCRLIVLDNPDGKHLLNINNVLQQPVSWVHAHAHWKSCFVLTSLHLLSTLYQKVMDVQCSSQNLELSFNDQDFNITWWIFSHQWDVYQFWVSVYLRVQWLSQYRNFSGAFGWC